MHLCKQEMHVQTCGHLILCSQSRSLAREEGNVLAWRCGRHCSQFSKIPVWWHNGIDSSFTCCWEISSEILSLLAEECRSRVLCNQQPTHWSQERVVTSSTPCMIQSFCRVTWNRTGPDLSPAEETRKPSLWFLEKLMCPFDPYQQKQSWLVFVIVKSITGT